MIKFKAPANIALLKYWGKADPLLNIPTTSTISMTLDALSTTTSVDLESNQDVFYLNGHLQNAQETKKVSDFVDLFRTKAQRKDYVLIDSHNNFPTAAGLASSASGYAALAGALNLFFDLNMNFDELSTYARRGSGSATRSLHGGFVLWEKGIDHESSKAHQIDVGDWDIQMIVILCNQNKKKISSRKLMEMTKNESIFYDAWVQQTNALVDLMKQAVMDHDFSLVGTLAQQNAWQMHGTILGNQQPYTYLQARSFEALEILQALKNQGIELYETMDAGPNIKVLVQQKHVFSVLTALQIRFNENELIVCNVGPPAQEIV